MKYKHTQTWYLIMYAMFAVTCIYVFVLLKTDFDILVFFLIFFILILLASFTSLAVCIDDKYLRIKFGYGIFRKKFLLSKLVSAKAVKNHSYYWWGIRVWFWPYMWIYNVSGFDAVEIMLSNWRRYRIGTDDPKWLKKALDKIVNK